MFNIFKTRLPTDSPNTLKSLPKAVLEKLEASKGVAFVLNPKSLILLAANTQGQMLFPELKVKGPLALDCAMPAMRKVQEVLQNPTSSSHLAHLVFWTAMGTQKFNCIIEHLLCSDDNLLMLKEEEETTHDFPTSHSSWKRTSTIGSIPKTDRETLDEIARLILQGQKNLEGKNSLPPTAIQRAPPLNDTQVISPSLPQPKETIQESTEEPEPKYYESENHLGKSPSCLQPKDFSSPTGLEKLPQDLRVLAHELRTPLSAIASVSEIIKDMKSGPVEKDIYQEYLLGIGKSARYALALIERLGQTSDHKSSRSQKQKLRFEKLPLTPLIKNCLSMIKSQEKAKEITFKFAPPYRTHTILADEISIRQIILNLLTNALKFTPAGGRIEITVSSNNKGDVVLSIADTGRGMTSLEIVEILKRKDHFSDTRELEGLGVGLPLSKALAEANGALLSIDSRLGKGTTTTVTFPKRQLPVI